MSRPTTNEHRLMKLRVTRLVRGYLTLEERFEVKRLEKQEAQRIERRKRYATDPEFRDYTRKRIVNWQQAQREARA